MGKTFKRTPVAFVPRFLAALLVIALLGLSAAACAEEITYVGDGKSLRGSPSWLFLPKTYLSLFPGFEKNPLASGNKVTIDYIILAEGVTNPEMVFGGFSKLENAAEGNSVTLLNGHVDVNMYGGFGRYGGVADNTVTIGGGFVGSNVYGGGSEAGNIIDNIVIFNGGYVYGDVYGGYSYEGSVTGNSVTINGGSVGGDVFGGDSYEGSVAGNAATINSGAVKGSFYGGKSLKGDAVNNSVAISGGSVGNHIYGGIGVIGSATGNTVTISGSPNLEKAYIFGGYTEVNPGDNISGNVLRLKSSGISAMAIGNFEHYNFYLPQDIKAKTVMLSVTDKVNLAKTTVEIFLQGDAKLKKGDKIALIYSADGISDAPKNKKCKVKHSGALYEFSIYTDKNNLWAQVTKISAAAK